MRLSLRLTVFFALAASGCGGGGGDEPINDGERLYREPLESGNTFACATCHALEEPAADGFRRPGHPIGDATRRPSYKNGRYTEMLPAVNTCVEHWMNAEPWAPGDAQWQALHAFLDEQAPAGDAPALSFEIVEPPADLSGGDVAAGRELFNGSCAVCHGEGATGTSRAPQLRRLAGEAGYIAERVRTSGSEDNPAYDGLTGGAMPFWAADRLSDDELRDLVAYVQTLRNVDGGVPMDGGMPGDAGPDDAGRDCDLPRAMVGQTASLTEHFHDVGGTARVVDERTIEIEGFTYDGTGIDVRIYGGLDGDYGAGFSMSSNLVRDTPYEGETLRVQIPDGRSLADLDGISVWCVDVGVSFGDGMFCE